VDKRRLGPKCGVTALAKWLTTLMVAALFASDGALPFDPMLDPQPVKIEVLPTDCPVKVRRVPGIRKGREAPGCACQHPACFDALLSDPPDMTLSC
jgi:hypothetical protein